MKLEIFWKNQLTALFFADVRGVHLPRRALHLVFPKNLFVAAMTGLMLTGCLQTRNDVRENEQRNVMQQQVTTLQKSNADVGNRFADIEDSMRNLNGRVDVIENKLGQNSSGIDSALKASQQQNQDLNQKVALLQDALGKMEKEIFQLNTDLQSVKAAQAAAAAQAATEKSSRHSKDKDAYENGQEFFNKKDWKQAILQFQKYRDENPKGAKFADATYKIGVSFQELGMKD